LRESGRENPDPDVYYLLCYAWDKLAERDVVAVDAIDSTTLADLFARVLINGTNHLLKTRLRPGLRPAARVDGSSTGRIHFQEAIRRNATRTGTLPCDFDETELQRPATTASSKPQCGG